MTIAQSSRIILPLGTRTPKREDPGAQPALEGTTGLGAALPGVCPAISLL